jgi:UDP-N-acetylmuramoyl-L-alanyl-D-glutamate--2,6-diaminopimelate ligase
MNSTDLLSKYSIPKNIRELSSLLQNAGEKDLVFYHLEPGHEEVFKKRYQTSHKPFVVIDQDPKVEFNGVVVNPEDYALLKKALIDKYYPLEHSCKLAAVTGTNGKTTTVFLAMQIAELIGKKALSLGTYGLRNIDGMLESNVLTTPSEIEFRKFLYLYGQKYDVLFFEFSSHALDQQRLGKIKLDAAAWTNFTQDHLDYHKTIESYFQSKLKLISYVEDLKIFINKTESELIKKVGPDNVEPVSFSTLIELPLSLKAGFNQLNLSLAISLNLKLWHFDPSIIDFKKLKVPDGRFQVLERDNQYVVIDYAHTPGAMDSVLEFGKDIFPGFQLKVLFGCGGDRDKSKRPLMGKSAEKASYIYLTSDNPRNEDPQKIVDEIVKGLSKKNYSINIDRKSMIESALESLKSNEVLFILGKGAEDYQEIKGERHPFSDYQIVQNFWRNS